MSIIDELKQGRILLSDGATGTMLIERGLNSGECAEEWNISHPDVVASIARSYFEAGSDMLTANTFGALRTKLKNYGYADRVAEFTRAGVELARSSCPVGRYVAASVGPTGEMLIPVGDMSEGAMADIYAEQMDVLAECGIRTVCLETFSGLDEALCALRVAKERNLRVMCSFAFDATPKGFFTPMGVTPTDAAKALALAGADAIGSNCGNGIENMIEIAREMRAAADLPIIIKANAGLPEVMGEKVCYRETPEFMAGHLESLIDAGASIIGGCCGTTPDHIRAMRSAMDRRTSAAALGGARGSAR